MNIEELTGIDMNLGVPIVHEGRRFYKAKNVCDYIGIKNPSYAIGFLKSEEKIKVRSHNGVRYFSMWFVCESAIYKMIFKSRSRRGTRIRNIICEDLLPRATAG